MNRREEIKECDLAYDFISRIVCSEIGDDKPYLVTLKELKEKKLSIHRFINEVKIIIYHRDKIIVKKILEVWEEMKK